MYEILSLSLLVIFAVIKANEQPPRIDTQPCLDVAPVADFDRMKFSGEWFEYAKTYQNEEVIDWACIRIFYFPPKDDGTLPTIRLLKYKSDGSLHIQLRNDLLNQNGQGISFDGYDFTVVAVDYDNYALVSACNESTNGQITWKLTRARKPTDSKVILASAILNLHQVDQDNCPGDDWSKAELEEDDYKYEDMEEELSFYYNYKQ